MPHKRMRKENEKENIEGGEYYGSQEKGHQEEGWEKER